MVPIRTGISSSEDTTGPLSEAAKAKLDEVAAKLSIPTGKTVGWPKQVYEQTASGKWYGRKPTPWDIRKRALVTHLLVCEPDKKEYWRNLLQGHLLLKVYK